MAILATYPTCSLPLRPKALLHRLCRAAILLPLPMVLTGCYEEFTQDIHTVPVLCLNSLITAGQPIDVSVTRTWLHSDMAGELDHSVKDAVVRIYANGRLTDAEYLPQEGDDIRIEADSPVYGHADAEVTVPYAVPIKNVRYTPEIISQWQSPDNYSELNMGCDFNIAIEIDIDDTARTDNYYRFSYLSFDKAEDWTDSDGDPGMNGYWDADFYGGSLDYDAEPIFSEHIGVFESIMVGDSYGFTFFTDRQFQGKTYTLRLHYTGARFTVMMLDMQPDLLDCGYRLTLHSVSKSYYDWVNYEWQCSDGPLGDLGEIGLGEPLWAYSNVSTGAGVVAAQSTSVYTLNLRDFLLSLIDKP